MNKEKFLQYANSTFQGRALELVLKQIELFYKEDVIIEKNKYNVGDSVFLKKHTFMHGIRGGLDNFDWVIENGFVAMDFSEPTTMNKIKNSIGMWNIQNDCFLKDYINLYSGGTIMFWQRCNPSGNRYVMAPFGCIDKVLEENKDTDYWGWDIHQNKEVSFMPSLARDINQIAFILNMESDYAKEISYADVFNYDIDHDTLKYFLDEKFYPKFIAETERTPLTTDRESSIMFGLPIRLVEGVLVGRKIENDSNSLAHIKEKLPDCYICNIDGKVIA